MMKLQTSNYNIFGEMALPALVNNMQAEKLSPQEKTYFDILKNWNHSNDPDSKGATLFVLTWDSLEATVWKDEFLKTRLELLWPSQSALLDDINKYRNFKFFDDVNTPQIETLSDDVTAAFKKAAAIIRKAEENGTIEWAKYKDTHVEHLARIDAFSRLHLPIGGGTNTINAAKEQHGPSWRMIVSLTPETEAYGIYPGGESGNPGSVFYDNFVSDWAVGKYYKLWVMKASESNDKRVKGMMSFN
jgi:penicillin amidase